MSNWSPDELDDRPQRRIKPLGKLVITLAVAAGASGWLLVGSPWAVPLQTQLAHTSVGRQAAEQVAVVQAALSNNPVTRLVTRVMAFGDASQQLAAIAPADTRVLVAVAPGWWTRWTAFEASGWPRSLPEETRQQWRTAVKERFGLDWEADLGPWVSLDLGLMLRGEDDAAIWVGARDEEAAQRFLGVFHQRRTEAGDRVAALTDSPFPALRVDARSGESYALGVLAGYVVLAAPPAAFTRLADSHLAGGPHLIDTPAYQRVAGAWSRGALGHLFIEAAPAVAALPALPPTHQARRGVAEGEYPAPAPAAWPSPEAVGGSLFAAADGLNVSLVTAFAVAGATAEQRAHWQQVVQPLNVAAVEGLGADTAAVAAWGASPELTRALAQSALPAQQLDASTSALTFPLLPGLVETLQGGPREGRLGDRPAFRTARAQLPAQLALLLYADGENLAKSLDESWLPAKFASPIRDNLRRIGAIALGAEPGIDSRGFHRSSLTIQAAPKP